MGTADNGIALYCLGWVRSGVFHVEQKNDKRTGGGFIANGCGWPKLYERQKKSITQRARRSEKVTKVRQYLISVQTGISQRGGEPEHPADERMRPQDVEGTGDNFQHAGAGKAVFTKEGKRRPEHALADGAGDVLGLNVGQGFQPWVPATQICALKVAPE